MPGNVRSTEQSGEHHPKFARSTASVHSTQIQRHLQLPAPSLHELVPAFFIVVTPCLLTSKNMSSPFHAAGWSRTTRPTRLQHNRYGLRAGHKQTCRAFITLPDLSNFSPFGQQSSNNGPGTSSGGDGPEGSSGGQTYHERKILPYVLLQ